MKEIDCFKYELGTSIPASNINYGVLVDDENERLYYFDEIHKGLVSVDIKSGQRESILYLSNLNQFTPLDVTNNSLFAFTVGSTSVTYSLIKIDLNEYSTFTIDDDVSQYIPVFDDDIIIYRDNEGQMIISDFYGNRNATNLIAEPLSFSENGDELLIREPFPSRIFVYSLSSNVKEYIKHDKTLNQYYWYNNEIYELIINKKELTVNNLSTNTEIRYVEDYGFGYHLSKASNKICFINELDESVCKNQRFSLSIDDLQTNIINDVAESGTGHFSHIKIYDNGQKIVYWWLDSQSYYIDEL